MYINFPDTLTLNSEIIKSKENVIILSAMNIIAIIMTVIAPIVS